jgi:hypothetical protein
MHRPVVLSLFLGLAVSSCSNADSKATDPPAAAAEEAAKPVVAGDPLPAEPADPKVPHHKLRWVTAGGHNLGYDVFRAESESGPFIKLNERLIPGSTYRGDVQPAFSYVDATIDPRKTYWYYVEAVDLMGQRSRFTPVQRAAPKEPAPAGTAAAPPAAK